MRITGQENIARMFGVAPKTIVDWQEQGFPVAVRGRPGVPSVFDAPACIEWFVQREVAKVQGETPRDRLARLQAEEIELRLDEKRGLLVPTSKIEPLWLAMVSSAKSYLRSQTDDLAELLETTEGVEAKRDLIGETFDQFLVRLSNYDPGSPEPEAEPGRGAAPADADGDEEDGAAAEDVGGEVGGDASAALEDDLGAAG